MKRAFTLIELLVVIAIIAILAAILFPVFAQAKAAAKKTAALSNIKQTATATLLYTTSDDDTMPFAMIRSSTGAWQNNLLADVPVDWEFTSTTTMERHSTFWANSVMPYMKNKDMLMMPGATLRSTTNVALAGKQPTSVSIIYNGLLHTMSMSGITQSSTVPMFWYGIGPVAYRGQVLSVPNLRCAGTGDCRFNPGGFPDETNGSGSTFGSIWIGPPAETTTHRVFGTGNIFVRTDSSVKFRRIGTNGAGRISDNTTDPFIEYDANVKGTSYSGCRPTGSTAPFYWCFFRPDLEL